MWFCITQRTLVFDDATSSLSGSWDISIHLSGKVAVVAPVVTSSSRFEIPDLVSPTGDPSTMSKFPNKSATGNVSSACTSNTTLGSSMTLAIISEAEILPG